MNLYDKIQLDLREAMKARDQFKAGVLKMLVSAVKYYLASSEEARKAELTDQKVIEIVKKQVKQREESVAAYEEANRPDLADKEREEARILHTYLPAMLSEEEIERMASSIIEETNASGPQDMGRVMKELMERAAGRADGKVASRKVTELLKNG
ncbi:MAG TPA: glutamyl-tRNA amidotransferase [Kosmotogaceae bacterium]|nr:MAG: Uncharacterized protein XE05_0016 [Thermotogales bacterium 46_20]HAA84842.1 glutamyl-tRNA amidotransferase [Kosmotogaceae bacterium]